MMNTRTLSMILIVSTLIVAGFSALVSYRLMREPANEEMPSMDTGPLAQQFSTLTHAKLSSMEESTQKEIESELSRDLSLWVSSSRITVDDHLITVLSSQVEVREVDLQVMLPVPPASLEGDLGILITNSMLYGGSGTLPLLPGIRTDVNVTILIEPLAGGRSFEETISFSTEVVDPERGLLKLMELLEADMNGYGSGMARDMEYMLTTLARFRSTTGFGDQSYQSDLNVLNEGDVELAFNIALALRMTRWTGQVPQELIDSIDAFFRDQHPDVKMNPTGSRFWGQAEINNFNSFYLRNAGTGAKRSLGDIIEGAVGAGHADSADILGRYLSMDRNYNVNMNVLDMSSALEEQGLLNPRKLSDIIDSASLAHHPSYPSTEGLMVLPRDDYLPSEDTEVPSLKPVFRPVKDYMVMERDMKTIGFDRVDTWFTNADNSKTISDLESKPTRSTLTRCGSIPPPPKPADHDFRLEWNFELSGKLDVEASYEGYGGNAPIDQDPITHTVRFSFPLRVHTWFPGRPVNDMAYEFVNINTGKLYWDDLVTGWEITREANATEFYEDQVHPRLEEGFSILTSLLRTMEWYQQVPVVDDALVRSIAHSLSMSSEQQLTRWADTGIYRDAIDKFWENYTEGPGIRPEQLTKVWVEGHHLVFQYSEIKDVLHITSSLPEGSVRLSIYGMKIGAYRVDAQVITSRGLVFDISPYTDEYSIRGNIGSQYINEGVDDPSIPDPDVSSLFVEGGWEIASPPVELMTWSLPSPYVLTRDDGKDRNMTISFILAGTKSIDPMEIFDEARVSVEVPEKFGESQVSMVLRELSSLSRENGIWFGIRSTSTGGEGSHPASRTFLVDPWYHGEDGGVKASMSADLLPSGRLNSLVRDLIWGVSSGMVIEGYGDIRTILLEEVPSWTSSGSLIGTKDMIYATYTRTTVSDDGRYSFTQKMNVFSDSEPASDLYHPTGSEWELSTYRGLTILW
ncbi:MAG: hypothetical protein JXA22_02100 [Candidatus Thermoplasmatota archaeon]|nr:hypothetical protein [Candidatus Thermoplasmatota archaeon]